MFMIPPPYIDDATSFFIVEPCAELEINLIKYFRLSLGISYRFTSEISLFDVSSTFPLNGWVRECGFEIWKILKVRRRRKCGQVQRWESTKRGWESYSLKFCNPSSRKSIYLRGSGSKPIALVRGSPLRSTIT